ncbi:MULTISPECIES: hypothetical protein [Lentisalinibacter]|uniref:hypothetical protein n=1 Tax=Lentisalinibacter TaxID=3382081 RepID=UPI0038675B6C
MDSDDRRRGVHGVVVSLLDTDDDSIRVTLDDVENDGGQPSTWTHRVFVTSKSYDKDSIENLDLPEDEYAALGHYVLARLKAIRNNS